MVAAPVFFTEGELICHRKIANKCRQEHLLFNKKVVFEQVFEERQPAVHGRVRIAAGFDRVHKIIEYEMILLGATNTDMAKRLYGLVQSLFFRQVVCTKRNRDTIDLRPFQIAPHDDLAQFVQYQRVIIPNLDTQGRASH